MQVRFGRLQLVNGGPVRVILPSLSAKATPRYPAGKVRQQGVAVST